MKTVLENAKVLYKGYVTGWMESGVNAVLEPSRFLPSTFTVFSKASAFAVESIALVFELFLAHGVDDVL